MTVTDTRNPYGYFLNPAGYSDSERHAVPYLAPESWTGWPLRKMVYTFRLDPLHPLTYVRADGTRIQPDRTFPTDWGSTPRLAQILAPSEEYPVYPLHDCCFRVGGLWHSRPIWTDKATAPEYTPYTFAEYTLRDANELLRDGILASGATRARADMIYAAVVAFAWVPWMQARREREAAMSRKRLERARAIAAGGAA